MITALFWITVGLFIGWNLPQPVWAQKVQKQIVDGIKKVKG